MAALKKLFGLRNRDRDELHFRAQQSGIPFQGGSYYSLAETDMEWQWDSLIWPYIENSDFSCVLELAAGHGRNSAKLRQFATSLILVDINLENLVYCKSRFGDDSRISYLQTDGFSFRGIMSQSVSLVYSFDSMVHFDSDVVRAYLEESYRVLRQGGRCFFHHSNYTENPGGNFRDSGHWRNFMSKELFAHYSLRAGFEVLEQKKIDWSEPRLDCLSLLAKPEGR